MDANTDLENCSYRLRVAMSRLWLSPPRDTNKKYTFQYKELDTCSHVFLRRIAIAPPLTALYDGLYKVVARSGRVFKVLIKGKVEMVTADRVKPAHIERTPKNEHTRQSKATAISKPTALQPMAKIHEPQMVVVDKRSTTTSTPSRARVCTKQNLNAQSTARTKETVPEVNQRGEKTEEQSNTRAKLYRARMPGTPQLLALTEGTKVSKHIHAFLYI